MKNIPRLFINDDLSVEKVIDIPKEQLHYLTRVMRTNECLVFNNGLEFSAVIENNKLKIIKNTGRADPSNNLIFAFAPIKQSRMEEMLNAATQLGVAVLQPVITEFTTEKFPKCNRAEKIIIESAEQSGRNSIPNLLPPMKFSDFIKNKNIVFADERFTRNNIIQDEIKITPNYIFVGPAGGFSDSEFDALDKSGATAISLGRTILRSETAAIVAISRFVL
ncbi:MAG: 16S rRNA (uracil(1498)-N(3))-methyltransferase [Rickettsiales bacterium]|jgi:16S rRNA (uracil1498-N3)-methyltransferase|nr:16S rRNA (uracil(1498)-N(3))-methyltransferase [Rickettsiales bacterium]